MQVLTQWFWGAARNPIQVASFSGQGLPLYPEKETLGCHGSCDSWQLQRARRLLLATLACQDQIKTMAAVPVRLPAPPVLIVSDATLFIVCPLSPQRIILLSCPSSLSIHSAILIDICHVTCTARKENSVYASCCCQFVKTSRVQSTSPHCGDFVGLFCFGIFWCQPLNPDQVLGHAKCCSTIRPHP